MFARFREACIQRLVRFRIRRYLRLAERKIARKDREGLIQQVHLIAPLAERIGAGGRLNQLCTLLQRLSLYEMCWPYRIAAEQHIRPTAKPQWDSGDLSNRTILLGSNVFTNRIGEDLRFARFIQPVAERAGRCIVCTEERLVPILRRTFPAAEVHGRTDEPAMAAEADIVADFGTLGLQFAHSVRAIEESFRPLLADSAQVASLRTRYLKNGPAPLIGISWWSRKGDRDIPPLTSWAPMLAARCRAFVSLQYGEISRHLSIFDDLTEGRLIYDPTVDQLVDMDRFAAQIAALDAVVSISNTTIDMAAGLGVPTVQIRDDRQHGTWPPGAPSPWYADLVVVYRNRRPWDVVMAEVAERLTELLAARPRRIWAHELSGV